MARADYYLCEVCEEKTFYDAELNYGNHENRNPHTGHLWPSGDVGFMAVICRKCAEKYTVEIVLRSGAQP